MKAEFSVRDQQILNNKPFSDDSLLRWHTDLPEEVLAAAPLWTDMRRFLQMLVADESWKLTAKGNLQRATLAQLMEAGVVGRDWWRSDRTPRNQDDLSRATLLRRIARLAGLTRKRQGRLLPTRSGTAAAPGTMAPGALYRRLLEAHTTRYDWASTDLFPPAETLQRRWWYLVWLLGRYGETRRPSTFYAERMGEAFPCLLREMMMESWAEPQDILAGLVESRGIRHWAAGFGLAMRAPDPELWSREPCDVWAGPLLAQTVRWRAAGDRHVDRPRAPRRPGCHRLPARHRTQRHRRRARARPLRPGQALVRVATQAAPVSCGMRMK